MLSVYFRKFWRLYHLFVFTSDGTRNLLALQQHFAHMAHMFHESFMCCSLLLLWLNAGKPNFRPWCGTTRKAAKVLYAARTASRVEALLNITKARPTDVSFLKWSRQRDIILDELHSQLLHQNSDIVMLDDVSVHLVPTLKTVFCRQDALR